MEAIVERFNGGGIFMYAILAFGLFTLYIAADRLNALFFSNRPAPRDFRWQVREYLKRGDLQGAVQYVKSTGTNSVAPIVEMACELRAQSAGDDEIQSRIDEALGEQIDRIDRRTNFLAVCGNVATLLGLLGTISGMITSFSAVSGATSVERAALLSKGISEAMNCTAFGLLVAIPALVGYAFFQNRTERVVNRLTDSVSKIYHDLIYLYDPATASQTK